MPQSPDQLEIIWLLMQAGVKIETNDKLGHSCITIAAMAGNTIGMSCILEYMLAQPQGPLNAQSILTSCDEYNHFDVLCHAVLADRKEPVLSLLGDYEYCHVQEARYCPSSRNLIHLAAVNGSTNALEALIKLCFDDVVVLSTTPDSHGYMPLAYAASNLARRHLRDGRMPRCFSGLLGTLESLQVPIESLVHGGSNVAHIGDLSADAKSWSTLVCDPRCTRDVNLCPHAEFASALLETGLVDVNLLHGHGNGVSALFLATLFGHIPMMRVLLDNGAKQDVGSFTPLQAAAATNNRLAMEILLSHTSKNAQNFMMERPPCLTMTEDLEATPLTIALSSTASLEELTLLSQAPLCGEDLQLALLSRDIHVVEMLLQAGLSTSAFTDLYGAMTGLATAVDLDDMVLLKMMLDYSPILSRAVDHQGRNILHHVCEANNSNALLLIFEELDSHIPDEQARKEELRTLIRPLPNGRPSPLEVAARQEGSPCFKILQSYLQESGFTKAELIASASSHQHQHQHHHQHHQAQGASSYPRADDGLSSYQPGSPSPSIPPTTASSSSNTSKGKRKARRAEARLQQQQQQHTSSSSSSSSHVPLPAWHQLDMEKLKKAVSAKLADFLAHQSVPPSVVGGGGASAGPHGSSSSASSHKSHASGDITISDISGTADDKLRAKVEGLLTWLLHGPDPLPYFKVLHSAQQHRRVSTILCQLNIVEICLNEALKATSPNLMQNWLRTLALLHRSDTPFLDHHTLNLIIKLLGNTLFMDTAKAQAYLMVTINNECAAHPKVSSLIVSKLSEKDNKSALLRFFNCCIKTVQDDEASPAGIGLLDLFTHVFLKNESFTETYRRVMGSLATSPSALNSLINSINNISAKPIDMSASLRMIQRVAQYFPTKVVLAGAVLPLLRICASKASEMSATLSSSAFSAFSDLLKFSNGALQKLLWKVMRHAMFIDIGLSSNHIEARTAACDAIVCLCRDAQTHTQLVSEPKYFDMLMKLFASLVPTVKTSGQIGEADALALRECILAISFLWDKDPARITAVLSIPSSLDVLLALYHTEGISAVASRIIQIIWAHDPTQCQTLINASSLTLRLSQAFMEKSGFNTSPSNLALLQNVEPFAVPKWHTPSDGVLHEDIDGVSCAYCGISETVRDLRDYSKSGKRYCSAECSNADASTVAQ